MKQIVVLSDIHGNLHALKEIYKKPKNFDMVIFLGDLFIGGDYPNECYEYLKAINPSVWIRGNTDEWVDDRYDLGKLNESCIKEANKAKSLVDKKIVDCVSNKDILKTIEIEHLKLFCIHDFNIGNSSNFLSFSNRFNDIDADIVLCGHTHKQFLIRTDNGIVLNPGSVFDQHFAIIEISESSYAFQLY